MNEDSRPPGDRAADRLPDTSDIAARSRQGGQGGAVWKLTDPHRQLDANVVAVLPGESIARHLGPDLDVLIHVIEGTGELRTEHGTTPLFPGALAWLPRRTEREFVAGGDGLWYLSVHQRNRGGLAIAASGTGAMS